MKIAVISILKIEWAASSATLSSTEASSEVIHAFKVGLVGEKKKNGSTESVEG